MNCSACGAHLPQEAANCPQCGAPTPYAYAHANIAPNDPTVVSSLNNDPTDASPLYTDAQKPPPTMYGSPSYPNPYDIAPPPPSKRPANRIGLIVGAVLVLFLIGGGVFAWLAYSSARNATAQTAQAATATAQAIATATANFTANGTFRILNTTTNSSRQDGQNKIYSYTQHGVNSGDITGSYTNEETFTLYPDNTGTFSGNITCACTLNGKSGTLLYSITGTSTANGFQGQIFNYQGTGGLAKLHGQGVFQGQGLQGTYSDELHFAS